MEPNAYAIQEYFLKQTEKHGLVKMWGRQSLPLYIISSHLTEDKLFPVYTRMIMSPSKMSLLLEPKGMPALNIKPQLILVEHKDDLGFNKASNRQQQILIRNLDRNVSRPNVTPGQILYWITNCIPIEFMFKENFPTNTQVWNSLAHQNYCQQRGAIWVTYGCYKGNPY